MSLDATFRILNSDDLLAEGLATLGRLDPVMARIVAEGARPALRKRDPGFHGLAWIVMGQQLSVASADAIWGRLVDRLGPLTPEAIDAAPDEALKACGLSAPKIRTLRALSVAIAAGTLPLDDLGGMAAEEAHAALTAVKGIGPWTADIYLMFCLGHCDAFAAGDLALQEAARLAYGLAARPSAQQLTVLAEQWRPWRTVAAKVLWAHYRLAKGRLGVSEGAKTAEAAAPPSKKPKRKPASKAKASKKGKAAPGRRPSSTRGSKSGAKAPRPGSKRSMRPKPKG